MITRINIRQRAHEVKDGRRWSSEGPEFAVHSRVTVILVDEMDVLEVGARAACAWAESAATQLLGKSWVLTQLRR